MKLQIALDTCSLSEALSLLDKISPEIDIIEIGTPWIIRDGLAAVRAIKQHYPEKEILADLKIADAGKHEALLAFEAGADIVTALSVADQQTLAGAIEAAREVGKKVLVDLIAQKIEPDVLRALEQTGADILCVHNAVDRQTAGHDAWTDLAIARPLVKHAALAVAGGINPDNIVDIVSSKPEIVIVGSSVTSAQDPVRTIRIIRQAMAVRSNQDPTQSIEASDQREQAQTSVSRSFQSLQSQIIEELHNNLKSVPDSRFESFFGDFSKSARLFVAGSGRSGLLIKAFAMRLMHLGYSVHVVGEVTTPAITDRDALLMLSGSGETHALIGFAQKARQVGVNIFLMTSNPASSLGRMAQQILTIAGSKPKTGLLSDPAESNAIPMGSLFEHSANLVLEAAIMMYKDKNQVLETEMFKRHANLE